MVYGPCVDGWEPNTALCSSWAAATLPVQEYALRTAIWVVWAAAGRRHGPCPRTVRPCAPVEMPLYVAYPVSYYGEGYWSLVGTASGGVQVIGSGCCGTGCACSPSQVALPGPVASITSVQVDGVTLAPGDYQLQGGYLVRMGENAWPQTQDFAAVLGAANTWGVTYLQGEPVPDVLNDAAGLYACEVARSMGSGNCRLPNRVQSVVRQGVEIQYVDGGDWLIENRTGVADIDQLIAVVNPNRLKQASRFTSPDMPQFR